MMQRILRLIAGLATLPALLARFRAPTYLLWMLRVGMTEWGHYSTFVAIGLFTRPMRRLLGPQVLLIWAGAVTLLVSPVWRAWRIAQTLEQDLVAAFGTRMERQRFGSQSRHAPLSWFDLVRGIRLRRQTPERTNFAAQNGELLALDFYHAHGNRPAPLVIVIHGGSWEGGDTTQLPALNHYLAGHGYAVAAISYRLAPAHPFPAAHDDVLAAIQFLKDHAAQYHIDASQIVLLGRSAGGHLALLSGYRSSDPAIRGVVALYPPTDLVFGFMHPANPHVLDSTKVLRQFLGGTPQDSPDQYTAASPISFVQEQTPPTLLIHGTTDELVSILNSRYLADALRRANRPHFLLELPWATHGCDANLSGPSGQLCLYAIERFLATYTQPAISA